MKILEVPLVTRLVGMLKRPSGLGPWPAQAQLVFQQDPEPD